MERNMKSIVKKKFVVVAVIFLLMILSLLFVVPRGSKAQQELVGDVYSKVTLYSNDGAVIGSWTAIGTGRMDGNTFLFEVYRGVSSNPRQIRINGTFTVEQTAP